MQLWFAEGVQILSSEKNELSLVGNEAVAPARRRHFALAQNKLPGHCVQIQSRHVIQSHIMANLIDLIISSLAQEGIADNQRLKRRIERLVATSKEHSQCSKDQVLIAKKEKIVLHNDDFVQEISHAGVGGICLVLFGVLFSFQRLQQQHEEQLARC